MAIVYLGLAWMLGLYLASVSRLPVGPWLLASIICLLAAIILIRQAKPWVWATCLVLLFLGAARFTATGMQTDRGNIARQVDLCHAQAGVDNPIHRSICSLRDRVQDTIKKQLSNPQAALLASVLLGEKNSLPLEMQEQFRDTGLSHIYSVPGLLIVIFAAVLFKGSQPIVGQRWSVVVALVGIVLYAVLLGADTAVLIAVIMGAIYVVTARYEVSSRLALAWLFAFATLITLVDPTILWDVNLQLGFVAAIGLVVYAEPLSKWTHTSIQRVLPLAVAKRLTFLVSDVLIATLAATLLVLPLVLVHFDQASVVSPLANLLVLPAQSGVIAFGILSTLIGMIVPAVGQVLASVAWLFLTYTIGRVRFLASLPGALVSEAFTPFHVVAIYALVFGLTWLVWLGPERRGELLRGLKYKSA